ncbi:MAG TPA: hypothetical protein VHQ22_21175 [Terriglobales bacterium]|jgi:hypothetical protein|nr:hypothetical protein [Terriglobales bacterium]
MSNDKKADIGFFAWVRWVIGLDDNEEPGKRFKKGIETISTFATDHGVGMAGLADMGSAKLQGLAYKDYAEVVKSFGEAEKNAIDTELARRSLECKVRKEEAEARQAELKVLEQSWT